jgi:putative endonuclease
MYEKHETGVLGEDKAAEYLKKKGYKILERNYKVRGGEIDIIALKKGVLALIEVKTRSSLYAGRPSEAVNASKQMRLKKAAEIYLLNNKKKVEPRFDVIEVLLSKNDLSVEEIVHIEDAFC